MTGVDLLFQLFALLLGFSVAELLAGLARSWRLQTGATLTSQATIRIGWLVPLLALLVLVDQTHFWLTAYELKEFFAFDYATLPWSVAIMSSQPSCFPTIPSIGRISTNIICEPIAPSWPE